MGLTGIKSYLFNTKIDILRRTRTQDSIGDFTEVWNAVNSNVPASIQPVKVVEYRGAGTLIETPQGKEYVADNKAYIPLSGLVTPPLNGDRVLDKETNLVYDIVGVEAYRASRVDVAIGHHYKLFLQIPKTIKS